MLVYILCTCCVKAGITAKIKVFLVVNLKLRMGSVEVRFMSGKGRVWYTVTERGGVQQSLRGVGYNRHMYKIDLFQYG